MDNAHARPPLAARGPPSTMKTFILLPTGIADVPVDALEGQTPL